MDYALEYQFSNSYIFSYEINAVLEAAWNASDLSSVNVFTPHAIFILSGD
jgi:hypothetical protein